MDKKRYLKTEIKSICGLRNEIESCKGTITLLFMSHYTAHARTAPSRITILKI